MRLCMLVCLSACVCVGQKGKKHGPLNPPGPAVAGKRAKAPKKAGGHGKGGLAGHSADFRVGEAPLGACVICGNGGGQKPKLTRLSFNWSGQSLEQLGAFGILGATVCVGGWVAGCTPFEAHVSKTLRFP